MPCTDAVPSSPIAISSVTDVTPSKSHSISQATNKNSQSNLSKPIADNHNKVEQGSDVQSAVVNSDVGEFDAK